MTCKEARLAMMTAEPRELPGGASGAFAAHVADCPACAETARMLSSALSPLAERVHRRGQRRAAMVVGIPAAAAAVVFGVVIARPNGDSERVAPHFAIPANVVSVDVKAGQHATVLKTSDPTVTVVWISPGGSE
jgi:hypothetical protein